MTAGRSSGEAAEALAILDSAETNVRRDQMLDFGPWWYALIYSFVFAAWATSLSENVGYWFAALASLVAVVAAIHDSRRRPIQFEGVVGLWEAPFPFFVLIGSFAALTAGWVAAVVTLGDASVNFFPVVTLGGWIVGIVVMLVVRAIFHRRRDAVRAA